MLLHETSKIEQIKPNFVDRLFSPKIPLFTAQREEEFLGLKKK
jgi:hypothetical protein